VGGSAKGTPRALSREALGRLGDELRAQRNQGREQYPIQLTRLFELAALPADVAAMRELVNPRASKVLRVTAKQRRPDDEHYREALAFLPEDADQVADSAALIQHALRRLVSDKTQAFTLAQLTDALPTIIQSRFRAAVKRRVETNQLWPEVASALYRGARLFLLLDAAARPAAASSSAAAPPEASGSIPSGASTTPSSPAPLNGAASGHVREAGRHASTIDFAGVFEREFERLDRASGGHNQVLLHDLRRALPEVERDEFDAHLNELRQARRFSLDGSGERQAGLSHEQLDAGIREGSALLVYVARR
jgi:hypothetical protein